MKDEKILVSKSDLLKFTIELQRKQTLLLELYRAANPTFLDDDPAVVRLSPEWNERILKEIQDENQKT